MYTHRSYSNETDYQKMRTLLMETFPLTTPPINCLVGEIDWWRATSSDFDLISKVRLWFHSVQGLVGFTWPHGDQTEIIIHPAHRGIEREMILDAETCFLDRLQAASQTVKNLKPVGQCFHTMSYESDPVRNGLLQKLGYHRVEEEFLVCHRLLFGPENLSRPPPPPAGYKLRTFKGESEIEDRVNAHRSAFHPSTMTVEKHQKVMASPTYRPDLEVVCESPEGLIVAYTIIWWDEKNKVGIFEPVGTHAEHQRRGLSTAVLREGLHRMQNRGAHAAFVMSQGDESPGARTYKSLGFEVIGKLYQWKKSF